MSHFIFNGVDSNSLGLIITQPIIRPTWAPEVEYISLPGRPRQLPHQKTWYPQKEFTVQAVLSDASPAKVRDVYEKLRGYGVLNISTAPHEFLNVYVQDLDPQGVALLMAEFPITFNAEPFAYSDESTTYSIANEQKEIHYTGTAFCDPQIVIHPSTTTTSVTCNGSTITVSTPQAIIDASYSTEYSLTLDCEGELAYYTDPQGVNTACTQLTSGKFPRLHTGYNYIGAQTVISASMTVRDRWY